MDCDVTLQLDGGVNGGLYEGLRLYDSRDERRFIVVERVESDTATATTVGGSSSPPIEAGNTLHNRRSPEPVTSHPAANPG